MANYTQSVREILQFNKRPAESLTNISDVYAIASRSLFANAPINVLDNDYQQRFVTGFALHFMNEELGYETLPLWQIALNEKLFNNANYINKIFENLDKEIFKDYNVKQIDTEGTKSGSKEASGSLASMRDVGTSSIDTVVKDASDVLTYDTSDVLDAEGTHNTTKSGSELTTKDGTDILAKKGSETKELGGSDTLSKSGSEITSNEGGESTFHSMGSKGSENSLRVGIDTPQGQISQIRSTTYSGDISVSSGDFPHDFDIDGTEGVAVEENAYSYMTAAEDYGKNTLNTETSNDRTDNDLVTTTSYEDREDTTEYGRLEKMHYGKDGTTADARTDETTYGGKESVTYGKRWTNNNEVADPRTDNISTSDDETRTKTGTESRDIDDTTTNSLASTVDDDLSQTTENTETTSDEHADSLSQTDYNINLEMIYRSIPLLNKVWEIFDDLFMLIF